MATEEEREIARLEAESLKEYTSTQDAIIQQAKASRASAAIPPELVGMDLSGTAIGSIVNAEVEKASQIPSFDTEEGMKVRGLLDENGQATKLGEDYLLMEERGLIQNGELTKKAQAFLTPMEDLLVPDQITNLTSTLSTQDPKTLEKFELYKIRKNSGIDVQDSEESLIKGIISGLGDVARTTGIAIGESGATKEQRDAARMAIVEGAIETPIQMSGKTGAFIEKFVINPVKRAAGVPQEQLDANEAWADYQNDSRQAMYDNMTGASLVDAVTDTTQGSEIYQTAKQQFIDRDGPVQGEINFNKLVAGGAGAGSMATDPIGLALSAFTLGGGILPKLSKMSKIAKAESTALQATSQLERLGEAASLVGRQIDDTTAQIGTLQKSIDDAVLVGDNATAAQLTSDLRLQTSKLDDLNKRAGMLDEGAQVNQRMFQQASTKIDDLNAPSMLGQKIKSGSVRTLADATDMLGSAVGFGARGIKAVERVLGFHKVPWIARIATGVAAPKVYATYYGIRQGLIYGAPALKKLAQFGNTISDELLEATSSNPFWRRVAANQSTGRLGQAFAGLMDYTTPIRRGIAFPIKGAAKALPATTLYEAINAGGLDEAALERAGANALVFGPIARLAGGKKDWDQASAGDLYNFRNKLRSTDQAKFEAFESIPDKQTRQFISSFDAAYPGMYDYKFTQSGNSLFDDNPKSPTFKTAIINVNDKPGMIKALAGHEINHALQFKNQSDDAVKSLMLGSEGKKGLVRDANGNLDPEFKAWGDEYNSRLEAQDIPSKSVDDLAIEYYTDIGAQTLFEDVVSGRVYKAGQKTKARRKIEEVFNKTMSATPIIKDLHFKFGGATDGNGRMIMGSGLLADGIRELPEVKAMVRNMYRESAGLPSKSEVAPNDGFSQSTNPIHHQAADAIRELNQAAVKSKTPLIDAALQPDAKGNGAGRLPSKYFEEFEARGIIPEGTWGMAVDINENMDLPVSYLLNYRPVRQGRSTQIDGRTVNNIKPIGWGLSNGRLYLAAMDINQLNINISRATKSNVAKNLKMSRNDIMNDIDAVADLQSKNKSTDDYFKRVAEEAGQGKKWKLRKNFINATQGLLTPEQAVENPMFNALGQTTKSGIYRTFAFDLLDNATRMTGTKVVDYGPNSYYTLKSNLMPQMPRVNRNGELVTEPTSAKNVKFMPEKLDADYMKAVESGNVEVQQRLVDEAARKAGYNTKAYHGTIDKFNAFDMRRGRVMFYTRPDLAKATAEGRALMSGDKELASVMQVFLKTGKEYRGSRFTKKSEIGDADSIVTDTDTIVVFNPNQIKSSDLIVRDDSGNIIPLSKRFDTKSSDIRFMPQKANPTRLAKDLASKYKVPLNKVNASGSNGEITPNDIRAYIAERDTKFKPLLFQKEPPMAVDPTVSDLVGAPIEYNGMRGMIVDESGRPSFQAEDGTIYELPFGYFNDQSITQLGIKPSADYKKTQNLVVELMDINERPALQDIFGTFDKSADRVLEIAELGASKTGRGKNATAVANLPEFNTFLSKVSDEQILMAWEKAEQALIKAQNAKNLTEPTKQAVIAKLEGDIRNIETIASARENWKRKRIPSKVSGEPTTAQPRAIGEAELQGIEQTRARAEESIGKFRKPQVSVPTRRSEVKSNSNLGNSISLLLSGQSSRQMEREERNNQ